MRGMAFIGGDVILNGLALCAGYGGLELGIERVFPSVRTVCYVEGEAYAASHLVKKMEEGRLHHAPIWNDVRTFDGKPWRGKVDIIAGGFPCQPFSSAGKQLGDQDPRHLWPFIKRIIGEVRPGFLFFENVPGVIRWILPSILLDLAELGYNASWGVVAASEVGAPHRRKRWFLFGVRSDPIDSRECVHKRPIRQKHRNDLRRLCSNVSDTDCEGWDKVKLNIRRGKLDVEGLCYFTNANNRRSKLSAQGQFSSLELFSRKSEKRRIDRWGGKFDSWWEVEPGMGRLVDGATDWVDKLRILGNGVVPQQAAHSLQILGGRLAWGIVAKREPKG
jgi:DNA (cytosine-5)-methyltransferase 1